MTTQAEALKIARDTLAYILEFPIAGNARMAGQKALAALATVDASPSPSVQPSDEQMEKARDAVAEALGDAYDCTRVWSAWGYETMTRDDFSMVAEDSDRVAEITDAAIKAILSTQPAAQTQGAGQAGMLRATLYAIAHTLDDHELRKTAKEAYEASFAQPAQPISSDAQPVAHLVVKRESKSKRCTAFATLPGYHLEPGDELISDTPLYASPAPDVRPSDQPIEAALMNALVERTNLSTDAIDELVPELVSAVRRPEPLSDDPHNQLMRDFQNRQRLLGRDEAYHPDTMRRILSDLDAKGPSEAGDCIHSLIWWGAILDARVRRFAKELMQRAASDPDVRPSVPVSDEQSYLHWCQTLIAALKRLSLAAQTTGGTAGPDAELQAAIAEAERAMSLGACSAAIDKAEAVQAAEKPRDWIKSKGRRSRRGGRYWHAKERDDDTNDCIVTSFFTEAEAKQFCEQHADHEYFYWED